MGEARDMKRKWETDEEAEDTWKEVDVIQQMDGRKCEVRVGVLKKWGFWKSRIIKSKCQRWYKDNGKTGGRWKEEVVVEGLGENVYTKKWRGRLQPGVHRCLAWTSNTYPVLEMRSDRVLRFLLDEYPGEELVSTTVLVQTFHYSPRLVIKYLTCHCSHL